jgi:hypothetical protein
MSGVDSLLGVARAARLADAHLVLLLAAGSSYTCAAMIVRRGEVA